MGFPEPFGSLLRYIPQYGYMDLDPNWNVYPLTTFCAFDLATHQMRDIEPGVPFLESSADVRQDLLVLISPLPGINE